MNFEEAATLRRYQVQGWPMPGELMAMALAIIQRGPNKRRTPGMRRLVAQRDRANAILIGNLMRASQRWKP